MSDYTYKATFRQSHVVELDLPAHLIASLVADKLGQPVPLDDKLCMIDGVRLVTITYNAAFEEKADILLTLAKTPDEPATADEHDRS